MTHRTALHCTTLYSIEQNLTVVLVHYTLYSTLHHIAGLQKGNNGSRTICGRWSGASHAWNIPRHRWSILQLLRNISNIVFSSGCRDPSYEILSPIGDISRYFIAGFFDRNGFIILINLLQLQWLIMFLPT